TAYNYSASGPILPLDSQMLALTPISPFRPRRWKGAILPDRSRVTFRVLEPQKRPVSAVADQKALRDIAEVRVHIDRTRELTLLFDPGHAPDDRTVAEQFAYCTAADHKAVHICSGRACQRSRPSIYRPPAIGLLPDSSAVE